MEISRDRFAEVLGTPFLIKTDLGQSLNIELEEVSDLRERPRQVSFSLLFSVPETFTVEQGLYDLEHEVLGAIQLFLVPVLVSPNVVKLEAVFNFLRPEEAKG
ncbi:MAG TPA: hypothetical protein VMZ26_08640 [Pyrinomonadaceae bacterium]|nr:hypothetical protein [Pyrinomonadaceae bacterium]